MKNGQQKWCYPRKLAQVQINNSHGLKEIIKKVFPLIKLKEKDIRIKEEMRKTEKEIKLPQESWRREDKVKMEIKYKQ